MKTMKKISMILSATLAVFALASCKQDININPADGETVVGSIPFELAASADEFATRTALDATTWNVSWESATQRPDEKADIIYAVTTDEEWGLPYDDDQKAATVAEFEYNGSWFSTESTISDGEHTFLFMYSNNNQKSWHRGKSTFNTLYGNQSMDATAPTAGLRAYDALAGKVTVTTPAPIANVKMKHLYTLMKVTLKNQTGADITVTGFSMSVADGTPLYGKNSVSFEGTDPVATYSENGGNEVTVSISNGAINAEGTLDVYFVILPLTNYSGDVTFQVATASDTYTKTNTVSALSFAAGSHNSASYTLKNADDKVTEPVSKTGWYRVEDASWLKAGDKVAIVAPDESLAMSTTQNTNNRGSVSIVKGTDGDYQTFTSSSSDYQIFVLEAGAKDESFAFKCSNGAETGKYIFAASSSSNYLKSQETKDDNASFTVSVLSGEATVIAQGTNTKNILRFNPNTQNNNPLFSCYSYGNNNTITGTPVSIYKQYGEAASYTLTVDPNTVNGTIDADPKGSVQAGTNVTLTATPADGYVLDAWSVKDEAGADAATVVNNTFSMPAKNVTVSATFKSATAVDFTSIAELKAKITGNVTLKGTLSGVTVSYVADKNNAFLKDATGSILYYKSDHGLKQGKTFTGSITVEAKLFNNLREITSITPAEGDEFEGEGADVSPVTVTLADLVGHYDDYESEYVKVADLLVTGVSIGGSSNNQITINVSSGATTYVVFMNGTTAPCEKDDVITATGTVTKYKTTEQIKVWNAADIVKQGSTPPVVEPSITASDITGVAAEGVTDATSSVTISNLGDYTIEDPAFDGTVVTDASLSLDGSTLTYSVSKNNETSPRSGWIKITLSKGSDKVEEEITVSQLAASGGGTSDHVATIKFGSAKGSTKIEGATESGTEAPFTYTDTGDDSQGNTWTITTVTNAKSFTQNAAYSQVGSSKKPVTSITFTTTLSSSATIKSFSAKFGGFSGTTGNVSLKVGDTVVGSGSLDATSDVTVSATKTTEVGTVLTINVTGIDKGVKAYQIDVTYNN